MEGQKTLLAAPNGVPAYYFPSWLIGGHPPAVYLRELGRRDQSPALRRAALWKAVQAVILRDGWPKGGDCRGLTLSLHYITVGGFRPNFRLGWNKYRTNPTRCHISELECFRAVIDVRHTMPSLRQVKP